MASPYSKSALASLLAFGFGRKLKLGATLPAIAEACGQRRASRNHKVLVFPWTRRRPQAFRLSLRKFVWDR